MKIKNLALSLLTVASLVTLSGCSYFFGESEPPQLRMYISASKDINPNIDDEPTPVTVRVYQLNDNEMFIKNSFIDIYNDPEKVLGKSLIISRSHDGVLPATDVKIEMELDPNAKFVGVIAGFANYDNENGKALIKTQRQDKDQVFELKIEKLRLMLKEKKED